MATFGPDGSHQIDFNGTYTLVVPSTQSRVLLRFSVNGWWRMQS